MAAVAAAATAAAVGSMLDVEKSERCTGWLRGQITSGFSTSSMDPTAAAAAAAATAAIQALSETSSFTLPPPSEYQMENFFLSGCCSLQGIPSPEIV
jgi:hypothetical protein